MGKDRQRASDLASEYAKRDDALGWFDRLYATAGGDASTIPWADLKPNPHFVEWAESHGLNGDHRRLKALVCGCGLGDDAEALATIGFDVTAFDISPAAIDWAKKRFPNSRVSYVVENLLSPPAEWRKRFDFILESYTLQAIPETMMRTAMQVLPSMLAPGGTLLIIARGRDDDTPRGEGPPWPLSRRELSAFRDGGLVEAAFEDFWEDLEQKVRRFRVVYQRKT